MCLWGVANGCEFGTVVGHHRTAGWEGDVGNLKLVISRGLLVLVRDSAWLVPVEVNSKEESRR